MSADLPQFFNFMAKTRKQKEEELKLLKDKLSKSKSVIFTSQDGVSVSDIQKLRRSLRDGGAELQVTKKTFFSLLMKDKKLDFDTSDTTGSLGITFSYEDEVSGAKHTHEFSKEHEGFAILGGILEDQLIDSEKVATLASIPSREVLLGKTVGAIKAPVSGFVGVLSGTIRSLTNVLNSIKETK